MPAPVDPGPALVDASADAVGLVDATGAGVADGSTGSNPYRMTTGVASTMTSAVVIATSANDRPSRRRRLTRHPTLVERRHESRTRRAPGPPRVLRGR